MLALVRIALSRPLTFIVMALLIVLIGPLAALKTPVDILPDINIPVIAVVWQYQGLPDIDYPFHDHAVTVTTCGRICFNRQKVNLSQVFAGQTVGIKQTDERIWLVSFMDYDLGYFDDETCRLEPLANPFGPKVLPVSSV